MFLKASKHLEHAILETLVKARTTPCFYKVKTILTHAESDWSFKPEYITGLNIVSDYAASFMNDTSIGLELHPLQVLAICKRARDLRCTLILEPHSWKTLLPTLEENTVVLEYIAVIENPEDIMKQYSVDSYKPVEGKTLEQYHLDIKVPLRLQLFTEVEYKTRLKKVNTVFGPGTTLDAAIHWVLNSFEIEKAEVVPSKNPQAFNNMTIPPVHGIDSVFGYLQNQYGIYEKGLGHFFYNDTFYVWKLFDTEVETPHTLHIFIAPKNTLEGLECYHYVTPEGDVKIVTPSEIDTTNRMESGVENVGNLQVEVQADKVIDHFAKVNADGTLKVSEDHMTMLNIGKDRAAKTDMMNINYRGSSTNPFISASKMAEYQGIVFSCSWKSAGLVDLPPGTKVVVHYDDKDSTYVTQKGILCGVIHRLNRTENNAANEPFYVFQSGLSIFLEPEPEGTV